MKHKMIVRLALGALLLAAVGCGVSLGGNEEEENELAIQLTIQAIQGTQTAEAIPRQATITQTVPQVETREASASGLPTATPIPCNRPRFQSEIIPDGTEMDPGESFIKSWRIRNDGSCTWDTNYKLVFSSGDRMDGPTSQNLSVPVRPGETADFSINLKAPPTNGEYKGFWKLQSEKGEQFGNYWVQIRVGPPPAMFAVTKVTFNVHPNITMSCPNTVNIKAEITSAAAGTVTYYWELTPGGTSSTQSLSFGAAGKKIVDYNPTISTGGNYQARLYIDNPNHQWFGTANFQVTCAP